MSCQQLFNRYLSNKGGCKNDAKVFHLSQY